MKSRSWNLKETLSEGCAICEPPGILETENSDIHKVTNKMINGNRSCENKASCEKNRCSEIVSCKKVTLANRSLTWKCNCP